MYETFEKIIAERNLTAYKVAKEAGLSTATLTNWKKGRYVPKLDKLQEIADYLGVSIDHLMGLSKTVVPIDATGGLSPEFIGVILKARDKGFTPQDIDLALKMLTMARETQNAK